MDGLIQIVERVREYPEAVRMQLFVVSVVLTIAFVGGVWLFLFRFSLTPPQLAPQAQEEQAVAEKRGGSAFLPRSIFEEMQKFRAELPSIRKWLAR